MYMYIMNCKYDMYNLACLPYVLLIQLAQAAWPKQKKGSHRTDEVSKGACTTPLSDSSDG